MSAPLKTSPSVSPGVCRFWIQGPSSTKISSVSHLTVDIDPAALKIDYKDLHYGSPEFGRTLDHYSQRISGNITMNDEACSLFGCEVGGESYPGYVQVYDQNRDGTLSLGEVEAIQNPVHQHQFLSASYLFNHENDPACREVQLPKEQGFPEVAGKTIILKTPEAAMEQQRKYNEGEIFFRTLLVLGVVALLGGLHLVFGRPVPIWRRIGLLLFPRKSDWLLNEGPRNRVLQRLFPAPRSEARARSIERKEAKAKTRVEKRDKKKAERARKREKVQADQARRGAEVRAQPEVAAEPASLDEEAPTRVQPAPTEPPETDVKE